jgi:hypothetical protein
MRVVVAVTRSRIPRLVAVLVDGISIVVSIAAVAACGSYGCHHHQNAGGGFVNHHLPVPWGILSKVATRTQNGS